MKPMNKRLVALSLATALLSGTGATLAYAGHKGHHGCDRGGREGPVAALQRLDGLTAEQKSRLKEIRQEARDDSRELRDAMRDTRRELRSAMADSADVEAIRSLAEKSGDQKTAMIVLRAQTRDRINSVLTEAQREQLAGMRDAYRDGRRHRHGMRDL